MKKVIIILLSFISCAAFAHDDIAYQTSSGWSVDYGNTGNTDKTYPASSIGSVKTFFADYNGDGYFDLCKVTSDGTYLIYNWHLGDSSGNFDMDNPVSISFGIAATDQCIVGDFNGDGRADIAVARTANNQLSWYIDYAPCDRFADISGQTFGNKGDIALAGDFNADGIDDICVYRPASGQWFVSLSNLSGYYPVFTGPYAVNGLFFGLPGNTPLTGDFNGDGYDDMAVYRPSENKIFINYFNPDKPLFEGYADITSYGSIDNTITCPVSSPIAFTTCDFNYSRPSTLPLANTNELGKKVGLRHGWTCIFDNSLDVDKWVEAWKAVGINTLEYHPWMRAHEEIAPQGSSWNTYVGDDRLWTSKSKMKEKIEKFRAIGGRSICYTGIYASAPAFAYDHPYWAMKDGNGNFLTYGGTYLNLMATSEDVDETYTVNGKTFNKFNDYFVDQAKMAETEFNWDGWRWDWYGFPELYDCDGLSGKTGKGNFSYEIGQLTNKLNIAVKNIRPDVTTTTLQLPNASGNVPFLNTAAVVDHQFMELWPESGGTGDKYSDLYREIYKAKAMYPDKPVFANFYPPTAMNLKTGWPLVNIRYQFATCLAAGGYPAAQVVDGIASFTDPVPFHAVNYPTEALTEISKWNRFAEAYGGYFYYSNPRYLIRDIKKSSVSLSGGSTGLWIKAKERVDKQTRNIDEIIINLIDYGTNTNLRWTEINNMPGNTSCTVSFTLPSGLTPDKAYIITPDGKQTANITTSGQSYNVSINNISLFATLVITTNRNTQLPEEPESYSTTFPDYKFEYDAAGKTLNNGRKNISLADEQQPLVIENYYNGTLSSWEFSDDAYAGTKSIAVKPGKLFWSSNENEAIRIPVSEFTRFKIAVKGNNAGSAWFGFRLLNPSATSSIWEKKDIYYRIGDEQAGLPYISLTNGKPNKDWTVYERNILDDIKNHPYLTVFWKNAIIIGVHYGPITGDTVQYDQLEFMTEDYSGIHSPNLDNTVQFQIDPKNKVLKIESESSQIEHVTLFDCIGKTMLSSNVSNINLNNLQKGTYLVSVLTNNGNITKKITF